MKKTIHLAVATAMVLGNLSTGFSSESVSSSFDKANNERGRGGSNGRGGNSGGGRNGRGGNTNGGGNGRGSATPSRGNTRPTPATPSRGGYRPAPTTPSRGGYRPAPTTPSRGGYRPAPTTPSRGGYRPAPSRPSTGHYGSPRNSGYRHVPYRGTYGHSSYWRTPSDFYRYTSGRYTYRNWVRWPVSHSNGFYFYNSYPWFVFNGYLNRYSNLDICNYELVDGESDYAVRTYYGYTCNTGYDICANQRDDLNYNDGYDRYYCAETTQY